MVKHSKSQNSAVSDSQIEIGLFDEKEEQTLLAFFAANLETWDRFHLFWDWRQRGLPHSGGKTAVMAKADQQIVGCVCIVPADTILNGHRIKASWQQDSLVAPSMRGKGLGKRLVNEGSTGWDLVIAKGTNKPMYCLRKSLGFVDAPNHTYLLRVSKPRTSAKYLTRALIEYVLCFWKTVLSMPEDDNSIQVKDVNAFDSSFDTLAIRLSTKNIFRLNKGKAYLNWRYFQCPGKEYKVFRAGGKHAKGAIVLNISGTDSDEGWIVDMLCSSDDKRSAYNLLRTAVNYFDEHAVSRIWAFATLPAARKWLRSFGFVPTNQTPGFTYRVHADNIDPATFADVEWDFWHGDGDLELYM